MNDAVLPSTSGEVSLYSPLTAPSDIRLLALATTQNSNLIQGRLIERAVKNDQQNELPYIALSYHWGDPLFDHEIELNGHTTRVTRSVFEMLEQLAKDKPGLYWIDQICINQNDPEERATQVLLMTQIYRNASHVHVWLGPEHLKIGPAYEWILETIPKLIAISEDEGIGALDRAISKSKVLENPPTEGLNALLEREWFCRLWIIQEVTVNPNPIIMRCGSLFMDFDVLSNLGLLLDKQALSGMLSDDAETGLDLLAELRQTRDPIYYEAMFTSTRANMDLLDLVSAAWRRRCSDPRDRIYALAGLTHVQHLPYPPSYIEPVDVIYMDYASHRIGLSHNLRILEWCRWSPDRLPHVPSWAPDWTHIESQLGTPWKQRENLRIYSAGGTNHGQYQSIAISRAKRALTLRGVLCDRIHQATPFEDLCQILNSDAGVSESHPHLGNGLESLLELCGPFSAYHTVWDIFWRFLFCDKSVNDRGKSRAIPEDSNAVHVFINHIVHNAQTARYQKQQELLAASNLDAQTRLLSGPEYGRPLAEFRTRPPEIIRLPSNRVLCYLKELLISWEMRYDDAKVKTSKALRKIKHHIRPVPPPVLKYPHPLENPDTQWKVIQDSANLFRYITRKRSFAITEAGRLAWVPDATVKGDQIAIILAYDLPIVVRKVEDNDPPTATNVKCVREERPDQYHNYEPGMEFDWISDSDDAEEGQIQDRDVNHQAQQSSQKMPPTQRPALNTHLTRWPRLKTRRKVHGEKFLIIGEAYVQGIMDGEVVEDMNTARVQNIVFV